MAWRSEKTKDKVLSAMKAYNALYVFDTETTGLKPDECTIIQLSAIKYKIENDEFIEEARFDTYINPEEPLPQKIIEITGITDDTLKDAPCSTEAYKRIRDFLGNFPVVCGQNVGFDIRFLKAFYKREAEKALGKTGLTDIELPSEYRFEPMEVLDTLEMAKDLATKDYLKSYGDVTFKVGSFKNAPTKVANIRLDKLRQIVNSDYEGKDASEKRQIRACTKYFEFREGNFPENNKLGTLAKHFGLDAGLTFHNSMDDVIATGRLLKVFYEEYKLVESEKEVPVYTKYRLKAKVQKVRFWEGFQGRSRVYIYTDTGPFYYDVRKKSWEVDQKNNPYTIDEIDMEKLKEDTLEFAKAEDENALVRYARAISKKSANAG